MHSGPVIEKPRSTLKYRALKHARNARIIYRGHEPAYKISIPFADRNLGIIHDAVDVFIPRCKQSKRIGAGNHDRTANGPGQDAERQVPTRFR